MLDLNTFGLFLVAAIVLVITPGPDTVLVLSRTLANGTRAGLWTLVGTQTGNVIHALLAGVGISTLILLFPVAFNVLKIAGAVYLVFLAIKTWRMKPRLATPTDPLGRGASATTFYFQGLTNNLVNPKVIGFFLALFPQFIKPESGNVALQSLVLGATIAVLAIVWVGMLAFVVGYARGFAARSEPIMRVLQRFSALVFVWLAGRLVLSKR